MNEFARRVTLANGPADARRTDDADMEHFAETWNFVNVNTTDATVGATALLLPAQNTHTLHDPKRGTEHARAGGVEDGLGVGGLDGGGDVGRWNVPVLSRLL
jgi:hypothetical protein